jgi:5'-3' exonuclease
MIIVDGPFLAFRAFSVGGPDAMVGATLRTILQLRATEGDDVCVVWELDDQKGLDFRRDLFPDYKCRRSPKPESFKGALKWLQGQLQVAFGILQVWPDFGEADDAACTLARNRTGPVTLWSADHDWFQLVDHEEVAMIWIRPVDPDQLLTVHNIAELTDWNASQWLNFQSLAGDLGDDVPGLPQIAKKRAGDLLRACPEIVQLILSGNGDTAINKVMAADASMARWAQLAVDNFSQLELTRKLVALQEVPCHIMFGEPWKPGTQPPKVDKQLAAEALTEVGQPSLMDLLPREPDPWEHEEAADDPWNLGCG